MTTADRARNPIGAPAPGKLYARLERHARWTEGHIGDTVAELATLQGFPAGFTFCGTKADQAKQVGNAVPPLIARLLVEANRPVVEAAA